MFKTAVIISPNWKDYAQQYLSASLASLTQQDYEGEFKIFLIDNASTPDSRQLINDIARRELSTREWTLVINDDNAGFAKGNNVAMRQALERGYDAIALFNMDGILAPNCLRLMLDALLSNETNGAVQARLMLWPEQNKINSLGNTTHFLGFGYCEAYQATYRQDLVASAQDQEMCYPSGAAVIFRAEALRQVGLFDEEFWMYNEDQDLGWRLWLAGWRIVLAREAVFYHKYSFAKSIKQFYWQDRNRLLSAFKNYQALTLILLLPAWLISELGMWLAAAKGGWLAEKKKVYTYFLRPSNWFKLIRARRSSQQIRKVSDRSIVRLFSGRVAYQEIESPLVKFGNIVLNLYWQIVKRVIVW